MEQIKNKGGRPSKGADARRKTISISGTPAEIQKLKEQAKAEDTTVSRYVLDRLVK